MLPQRRLRVECNHKEKGSFCFSFFFEKNVGVEGKRQWKLYNSVGNTTEATTLLQQIYRKKIGFYFYNPQRTPAPASAPMNDEALSTSISCFILFYIPDARTCQTRKKGGMAAPCLQKPAQQSGEEKGSGGGEGARGQSDFLSDCRQQKKMQQNENRTDVS